MFEKVIVWLAKKLLFLAPNHRVRRNPGPRKKKEEHHGNKQPLGEA